MIKKLLFTLMIALSISNLFSQGIFISEVVDGPGKGGFPKYVELTNSTDAEFDLNGYAIHKSANGKPFAVAYKFESSFMLPAGASVVVTNMDNTTSGQLWSDFTLTAPTHVIYKAGINGNGDDAYAFVNATGDVLDYYGTEKDGTGLSWEYLDSYAYRNSGVITPNATFTQSEWTTLAPNTLDGEKADLSSFLTPGTHVVVVPGDVYANIVTFSFAEQKSAAVIDNAAATVTIEVVNGTELTALTPTITVSTGATISPNTGVVQDFTAAFSYVVTDSESTTKDWTVTVTVAEPTPVVVYANIVTFSFAEQKRFAVIDSIAATVTIEVLNGTDLKALIPTITVSTGATISPDSGVVQNFTDAFDYIVTASDETTKTWTVTVTVAEPAVVVTIYEIQGQGDVTPYDGKSVITSGIVTATSSKGYWIQDGAGAWNGIYVFDNVNKPVIGDSLTIEGDAAEFYTLTQVKNILNFTVNNSDNTLPIAEELTTAACNDEAYESVFVKVIEAICINADAGHGMWTINNGANDSDSLQIDDDMFHFDPILGLKHNVTGILNFGYGSFKILPRDADDIFVPIGINQSEKTLLSVYPNPAVNEINLVNIKNIDYVTVSDITGKQIANINVTSENVRINISELEAGMYIVSAIDNNGNVSTVKFIKK